MALKSHLPKSNTVLTFVTLRLVTIGRSGFWKPGSLTLVFFSERFPLPIPSLQKVGFRRRDAADFGSVASGMCGDSEMLLVCNRLHAWGRNRLKKLLYVVEKQQ